MNNEPIPRWKRRQNGVERFVERERERNNNGEIRFAERMIFIALIICAVCVGVGIAVIAWRYR